MILKNYWTLLNKISTLANPDTNTTGAVKSLTGTDISFQCGANNNAYGMKNVINNSNLKGNISFVIGTGNTPPEFDDYCLENDITSSISNANFSLATTESEEGARVVYIYSGTNNAENEITITEIGISKELYEGTSTISVSGTTLLVREILGTPITVPAGQGFVVTFEWNEG